MRRLCMLYKWIYKFISIHIYIYIRNIYVYIRVLGHVSKTYVLTYNVTQQALFGIVQKHFSGSICQHLLGLPTQRMQQKSIALAYHCQNSHVGRQTRQFGVSFAERECLNQCLDYCICMSYQSHVKKLRSNYPIRILTSRRFNVRHEM